MRTKIKESLRRLELTCKYVNKNVTEKGITDTNNLNTLDYPMGLLRIARVCPWFDGTKGVTFDIRELLYKQINNKLEYITLLDSDKCTEFESDYYYYECKIDIDCCQSIVELKRKVRAMIKRPDNFYRSE